MNKNKNGIFWMVGAMLCWGTTGFFLEFIPWNPVLIAGLRVIPAGLTIYIYMRIAGLQVKFDRRAWKIAAPMCMACTLYVVSSSLSTAANAGALQQISPFFLLLITAVLYKKPIRRSDLMAAVFTLFGVVLFFLKKFEPQFMLGNFLGFASGFPLALMYLFMGDNVTEDVRLSATVLSDIISCVLCLPFAFFSPSTITPVSVIMLVLFGSIQLGVSYIFLAKASASCPPLVMSLMTALVPPINALWLVAGFGRGFGLLDLAGMGVILVTIIVWNVYKNRHPLPRSAAAEKGTKP